MNQDMIQLEIDAATLEIDEMQTALNAKIGYRDGLKYALNGAGGGFKPGRKKKAGLSDGPIVHRRRESNRTPKEIKPGGFADRAMALLKSTGHPMHVKDIANGLGVANVTSMYTYKNLFRQVGPGMFELVDKGDAQA